MQLKCSPRFSEEPMNFALFRPETKPKPTLKDEGCCFSPVLDLCEFSLVCGKLSYTYTQTEICSVKIP